jgi:ubiquinone/menaquinone biosynthesis C-methylase UbiE
MKKKDLFSAQAESYAAFRPAYPDELYQFIFNRVANRTNAWDCGTGNGQVAQVLCRHFENVDATDISSKQLEYAYRAKNITYQVCEAENTPFLESQFDLITVAQALHWFDFDRFYTEVRRVARHKGIVAVWGYTLCLVNNVIDECILDFYSNIVGPYWDAERRHIENEYRDIPFPFSAEVFPEFFTKTEWTLGELVGFIRTWSATQKYIREKKEDPVNGLIQELMPMWNPEKKKQIRFPIFGRLGTVIK